MRKTRAIVLELFATQIILGSWASSFLMARYEPNLVPGLFSEDGGFYSLQLTIGRSRILWIIKLVSFSIPNS
jgi:hypothetical protein